MLIADLRKKAGMTQKDFAEYFEIPIDVVKSWESERRSPSKWAEKLIIEKMAMATNTTDKIAKITLKSEIVNFKNKYHYGDTLTVPILGYLKENIGSYELVFFNIADKANYIPVANGISKTGQKYTVFSRGDSLAAFFSENAALYDKEEVDD